MCRPLASSCSMPSSSFAWTVATWSGSASQRTRRPNGSYVSLTEAFPWDEGPRHLIRDRDRAYGAAIVRRVRAMGIRDKPIAPASPWQNGFAERLIGSIRRECVDHFIVLGEAHLRRTLQSYARYYNIIRTHWRWTKMRPFRCQCSGSNQSNPRRFLGGLHHHYLLVWVFGNTHHAPVVLLDPGSCAQCAGG